MLRDFKQVCEEDDRDFDDELDDCVIDAEDKE
jgi:hypothetical protein